MTENTHLHSGYAAIIGRPNVGKSTLLNRMLGQKISITSRKPQTTRHRIMGIDTDENCQTVFVDTPGIQNKHDTAIHRYMNRAASSAVNDVDVIVFVIDRLSWTDEDEHVLKSIQHATIPVILVINKVDRIVDKNKLLPHIQSLSSRLKWADVVPVSAKVGSNIELLQKAIRKRLPEREYLFDEEQITDRSERFLAAELIREKIMRQMGDELPHKVAVEIESYKEESKLVRINALIWVEREGQKRIIIGKSGERLKKIGSDARVDIEQLIAQKVMLTLWVKVKSSWSDDDRMLKSLGYADS
jgi:GTP-binding protein Era